MVSTSVGYKQLIGRRITFLVLPTFTFTPRTNLSLLFIDSTTISNLHLCRGNTSSPITKTYYQPLLQLLLYPNSYNFVLERHLNITDTIPTKMFDNILQRTFSLTNHNLQLLENQFLPQFYFHDLSFSHKINNLALKRLAHHHHAQSTVDNYSKHFQLQTKQSTTL